MLGDDAFSAEANEATPTSQKPGLPAYAQAPSSLTFKKLRKRIVRQTQEAVRKFAMDAPRADGAPQKWLICLSGGKDSYGLLAALLDLKWQGALRAELLVCNLDQGQPGFPKEVLPTYLDGLDVRYRIITEDTYSIVTDKVPEGRTFCSLCSRLRRGILYRVAREEGCDAIVLGHHRDDALETFMMNLLHGGRLAAMPPKLKNDEGDLFVLRPLIFTAETDLAKFSQLCQFPIIPCNLCGTQEGLQRQAMKDLLNEWEVKRPGKRDIMFRALQNVRPSHLVDERVFDFADLKRED
ncbi:MAG: tRNA 2-thiocytidine(32) synthetase TtcA [Pseudomonadota bacterium]